MKRAYNLFAAILVATLQFSAAAHAETRVISTSAGGAVEYRIDGTGPTVLMIPSLGRGASDFDDLSRRLVDAGFTAVRPEPRGIGKSAGKMSGITLHDLTADAAAVIDSLGVPVEN